MRSFIAITILSVFAVVIMPLSLHAVSSEALKRAVQYGAKGKVTLCVIDDQGLPVTNAYVNAGFYNPKKKDNVAEGRTNTNGVFVAKGLSVSDLNYMVTKSGYYKSSGRYLFARRGENCVQNGRWQPWNPTLTVLLKLKRNPVAMYAKGVSSKVPVLGQAVGYDLVKGDWVAPHGQGKQADMLFSVRGTFKSYMDRMTSVTISFPNEYDGIQTLKNRSKYHGKSKYIAPYHVPESNYKPHWTYERRISPRRGERINAIPSKDTVFAYRIRTKIDKDGNIVSALYGKIYGDITCDFTKKKDIEIYFTYYLNPDGSRNIEFDPTKNLFKSSRRNRRGWRP